MIIFIWWKRKLRLREVKKLAHLTQLANIRKVFHFKLPSSAHFSALLGRILECVWS